MPFLALPPGFPVELPLSVPGIERLYTDDDAVAEAVWVQDRVVQLTRSGLIVVRNAETLEIRARYLGESPAISVAETDGEVWVAFGDGDVARFDMEAGELTRVVEPPKHDVGFLVYLGNGGGHPIAVFESGSTSKGATFRIVNLDSGSRRAVTYRSGVRTYGAYDYPPRVAAAGGRLLVSWDWGEFGGDSALVDLTLGIAGHGGQAGALGFSAIGKRLLAFGGLEHFSDSAYIADALTGAVLWAWSSYDEPQLDEPASGPAPPAPEPDRPHRPISLIADGPGPNDVTVVSYGRVFRTDHDFKEWQFVAALPVGAHAGRAFSVGDTPAVTALHLDADGTITVGSDVSGFVIRRPDGTIVTPEAAKTGSYADQLIGTADGLFAGGAGGLERVGDPEWSLPWPEEAGAVSGGTWDVDERGQLRLTGVAGKELVSVTLHGNVVRVPIPEPNGSYDVGSAVRIHDRVLVGGTKSTRIWDGANWRTIDALDGFAYEFQHPLPVAGSADLVLVRRRYDEPLRLLRVPEHGTSWETVRTDVSGAAIAPNQDLAVATSGSVAVDGCGRIWRVQPDKITLEVNGEVRTIARPPGLWSWTSSTGRPEGVALGGQGLVVDIQVGCTE